VVDILLSALIAVALLFFPVRAMAASIAATVAAFAEKILGEHKKATLQVIISAFHQGLRFGKGIVFGHDVRL